MFFSICNVKYHMFLCFMFSGMLHQWCKVPKGTIIIDIRLKGWVWVWKKCLIPSRTEQLKKLGKIYYYLDLFHHYRSLYTPRVFKPNSVTVGTTWEGRSPSRLPSRNMGYSKFIYPNWQGFRVNAHARSLLVSIREGSVVVASRVSQPSEQHKLQVANIPDVPQSHFLDHRS